MEEVYWEENYKSRPYYRTGEAYEHYLPAYRFGWEAASSRNYSDRDFEELEPELRNRWEKTHSDSGTWENVRSIVRDAFDRIREKRKTVGLQNISR